MRTPLVYLLVAALCLHAAFANDDGSGGDGGGDSGGGSGGDSSGGDNSGGDSGSSGGDPNAKPTCTYVAPNGVTTFDLTTFSGTADLKINNGAYNYYIFPCQNAKHKCAGKNPSPVIQKTDSDDECYRCGDLGEIGDGFSLISDFDPGFGLKIKYNMGDECPGVGPRTAEVQFQCDPSSVPGSIESVTEYDTCHYRFVVKTSSACPIQHKLSAGWVLIIIFILALGVYFGGGVFYLHKYKGKTGIELIPNVEFWRELPGLIKDGCMYSWEVGTDLFHKAREKWGSSDMLAGISNVHQRGISKATGASGPYESIR